MATKNQQYRQDYAFGTQNEINVIPYIEKWLMKKYDDETLKVEKNLNKFSVFDYYVPKHNLYLEIKSRRNTLLAYTTQLVGMNKIKWGRTRMKLGHTCFYFWVLVNPFKSNKRDVFVLEEDGKKEYPIRTIHDKRYNKYSECALIHNKDTEYITSFEV